MYFREKKKLIYGKKQNKQTKKETLESFYNCVYNLCYFPCC